MATCPGYDLASFVLHCVAKELPVEARDCQRVELVDSLRKESIELLAVFALMLNELWLHGAELENRQPN